MISANHLQQIAAWARDLDAAAVEKVRRGIVEKSYPAGSYICHRGDRLDCWTGVSAGIVALQTVARSGKAATLASVRTGAWFGEGSLLKDEARQYDLVAVRDTKVAMMNKAMFFWLFETSAAFNRFLVRQFNERLGQFIALVEYDRVLDATGRVARSLAWLCNPVLYPDADRTLELTQAEIGLLAGLSRQAAHLALGKLEARGLIRCDHATVTIVDLERLARFGD